MKFKILIFCIGIIFFTNCTNISTNVEQKPLSKSQESIQVVENQETKDQEIETPKVEDQKVQDQEAETPKAEDKKVQDQKAETPKVEDQKNQDQAQKTENQQSKNQDSTISNEQKSWWFKRNKEHLPPGAQQEINITDFDTYYLGNTKEKVLYLTFDEGYENGYTSRILDILKENEVQAAFFVTQPYVEQNQELVQRMIEEGHVVGNHSITHPNLTTLSDEEVIHEIQGLATYYEEVMGHPIDPFFRPPSGFYSQRTLKLTQEAGYKTIFWSMAYKDWVVDDQPGKEAAYQHVLENHHSGAIILLHAISKSNTEALDEILKELKQQSYQFKSLYDLP